MGQRSVTGEVFLDGHDLNLRGGRGEEGGEDFRNVDYWVLHRCDGGRFEGCVQVGDRIGVGERVRVSLEEAIVRQIG